MAETARGLLGASCAWLRAASPVARIAPRLRPRIGVALVAIGALLFPIISRNDANIDSAANALAFPALALGLNIVVGFAGLLDLGYAAFFAIGAYTYGMLASHQLASTSLGHAIHLPFWLLLFVAVGVAAVFGVILGAPTLRLRGDYLAIVTLGFGEIVPKVFRNGGLL